jgi:hypothetical protein
MVPCSCYVLKDDDLHRYCHTGEGVGHALQAGEQATSGFVNIPVHVRWQEDACEFNQSSNSCVPFIRKRNRASQISTQHG